LTSHAADLNVNAYEIPHHYMQEIEESQGIELQDGEAIARAVFRNRYHHASSGSIFDITIEKSSK